MEVAPGPVHTLSSCRCVSSPQSNSSTSFPARIASDALCAPPVGVAAHVPSHQNGIVRTLDWMFWCCMHAECGQGEAGWVGGRNTPRESVWGEWQLTLESGDMCMLQMSPRDPR